jgi:hypothetical protein
MGESSNNSPSLNNYLLSVCYVTGTMLEIVGDAQGRTQIPYTSAVMVY